jgi:hypothetical protein
MKAPAALEPFDRQKTVLFTTHRRDGTPVGTPVRIVVDGDRTFVRTWDTPGSSSAYATTRASRSALQR